MKFLSNRDKAPKSPYAKGEWWGDPCPHSRWREGKNGVDTQRLCGCTRTVEGRFTVFRDGDGREYLRMRRTANRAPHTGIHSNRRGD